MEVRSRRTLWAFVITSVAAFMVTLDNLVVTTALPVIRVDLHASIEGLEWTVNAYTLTFAVLLLTGAALGDRLGRRLLLSIGLGLFVVGSAAAALAPSIDALVAARAFQGIGGAIVAPLTLTILSAAMPKEKRGVALGAWGGIQGLAVALGPVVGGAIVSGISWQWIFWLNVPIGLVLIPLALRRLDETRGPDSALDLPGLGLASAGLLGIVWGLVRGNAQGWASLEIVGSLAAGAVLTAAFVAYELRAREPMLPMRFFRSRGFAASNVASIAMSFGMFGSIFLLAQFLQTVQHFSPLAAGVRILPWTLMPIFIAPLAGAFSDRIGGRPLIAAGLTLQAASLAWLAAVTTPDVAYVQLVGPFLVAGAGMALFFAPIANVVLSSVGKAEEGKASGANSAIRELGGVFGVAVLASVFSHYGGYRSGEAFVNGLTPAIRNGPTRSAYGTSGAVTAASHASEPACSARPAAISGRPPIRSENAPASGATNSGINVHGRIRTPAASGEKCCTVCRNCASRKIDPNIPNDIAIDAVFEAAKLRERKKRIGSI
ncbi:MAG TPA: DHA2 family efflux MFS transporter permease subunit, partial [Gaiellaceae bacterium]